VLIGVGFGKLSIFDVEQLFNPEVIISITIPVSGETLEAKGRSLAVIVQKYIQLSTLIILSTIRRHSTVATHSTIIISSYKTSITNISNNCLYNIVSNTNM
jgi:hypothetical protein